MLVAIRALGFAVIAGCASGAVPVTGGDDDVPLIDASTSQVDARQVTSDASPMAIDAAPQPDAFVFQDAAAPPDAPPSLFCSANSQCTTAGECCIRLGGPQGFCGPGIPFADECIPQ